MTWEHLVWSTEACVRKTLNNTYKYLMEEHKEQRARLVSLVSTGRTRGNGHK